MSIVNTNQLSKYSQRCYHTNTNDYICIFIISLQVVGRKYQAVVCSNTTATTCTSPLKTLFVKLVTMRKSS